MISTNSSGKIYFFKEQIEHSDSKNCEFLFDKESSDQITNQIGLKGKGESLVENHISPDGRYILSCTEGIL